MQIKKFDDREAWLLDRRGKITGARVDAFVGGNNYTKEVLYEELDKKGLEYKKTAKKEELESLLSPEELKRIEADVFKGNVTEKIGFYELIAERLAVAPDKRVTPLDRGVQLEEEAIQHFSTHTGKEVDTSLEIWTRDDYESIAVSPDAHANKRTVAIEAKCLGSAYHIMTYIHREIPDDYKEQIVQYFCVNDKLKKLYMVFYDPRFLLPEHSFFYLEINRKDVQARVDKYLERQKIVLDMVDDVVNKLTLG